MALEIIPKPDSISWEEITDLLHRAFAEHSSRGLHYGACTQSSEVTRQRAGDGICLVALLDGKLVGTGLVNIQQRYGKKIGYLSQLGVLPEVKGQGIGTKIKEMVIDICRQRRADAIYCNTSEKAGKVVKFYLEGRWQKIGLLSFENTNYYSIEFRYVVSGRKYTAMEAQLRFLLSCLFCKSLWREDGSLRPIGKLLKKFKGLCKR